MKVTVSKHKGRERKVHIVLSPTYNLTNFIPIMSVKRFKQSCANIFGKGITYEGLNNLLDKGE